MTSQLMKSEGYLKIGLESQKNTNAVNTDAKNEKPAANCWWFEDVTEDRLKVLYRNVNDTHSYFVNSQGR